MEGELVEMHAIVHGYVQGVGFRITTLRYATKLNLTGTVKNLLDGTVEIFVQGSREHLEQLVGDLKEHPRLGEVKRVDMDYYKPKRAFSDFQVIY